MKILVQKFEDKFIRNLLSTKLDGKEFISVSINNNLYENHYAHNFSGYVFIRSLFTPEIEQFIWEFANSLNIIVYHDSEPDLQFIETYGKITKNIIQNNYDDIANTIKIPSGLINDQIFYADDNIEKIDEAICFLDNTTVLPGQLIKKLFPNKAIKKIKLFNNPRIPHYQNLGLLTEKEKGELLRQYKFYIDINEQYKLEAAISGCSVIGLDDLDSFSNTFPIPETISLQHFLQNIL